MKEGLMVGRVAGRSPKFVDRSAVAMVLGVESQVEGLLAAGLADSKLGAGLAGLVDFVGFGVVRLAFLALAPRLALS